MTSSKQPNNETRGSGARHSLANLPVASSVADSRQVSLEMLMVNDESIEQDSIDLTVEDCGDQTKVVVVSFEPSTVLKTVKSSQKYSFFCTFPLGHK